MYFELFVIIVVVIIMGVYLQKTLRAIYRFNHANLVMKLQGVVTDKRGSAKNRVNNNDIEICHPVISYELNGKKKTVVALAQHKNVNIGQTEELFCCSETEEIWVASDMPLLKKQAFLNSVVLLLLLIIMIVEQIFIH